MSNETETRAAVGCKEWLDALEREIASKEKYAHETEMNVGKTSSIHEADYARGVVDGLRVARSYGLAIVSASNEKGQAHPEEKP